MLDHAEPPDGRSDGALTAMIVMPILGFIVWLVGFLIWRAIKPAKARASGRG